MSSLSSVVPSVRTRLPDWLHTLDALRVPYLTYNVVGRRESLSPSMQELLGRQGEFGKVLECADRIVADEVARETPRLSIGSFILVSELEFVSPRVMLGVHLRVADSDWSSVAVVRPLAARDAARFHALTCRESEVARLIGAGLSTKEIAARLTISTHTARHHTERIFARLGVSTRAGVAAIVASNGTSSAISANRSDL